LTVVLSLNRAIDLSLVETRVLVGEPGAYRLDKSLDSLQVPATVQAVLAARIDRLPPEEKRLLQTAAVIGTDVPFALLRDIAELPEAALSRGLAHVQAAEFLYETRLFPEPEYTFKHVLTHEVAYSSLLQKRRRGLHARLVDALEALAPDRALEQVERLAHHAVRGEVWDKAVTYCQQAGARVYDRTAFREAVASFERALQALAHLPEDGDSRVQAIDLRLALGGSLQALGEYGWSLALLGEAEALARALDDRARLGWVLAKRADVLRFTGDFDGAVAAGQQALALAAALGERALQVRASHHLGQIYYGIGDFGQAGRGATTKRGSCGQSIRIGARRAYYSAWLTRPVVWGDMARRPGSRRHAGTRPRRCTSLVSYMPTPILLMLSRPRPTTAKPSSWPRSWACTPSRPTVTSASAGYMPRPVSVSRPVPNYLPLSNSIAAWRCSSGSPRRKPPWHRWSNAQEPLHRATVSPWQEAPVQCGMIDVSNISVTIETTLPPAIALPADAVAKQPTLGSSTDWRAFSVEREHITNRQCGEAAGATITVQKLDFEPIWRK
jgi:tetratricopeptide (TPR) repeat protein